MGSCLSKGAVPVKDPKGEYHEEATVNFDIKLDGIAIDIDPIQVQRSSPLAEARQKINTRLALKYYTFIHAGEVVSVEDEISLTANDLVQETGANCLMLKINVDELCSKLDEVAEEVQKNKIPGESKPIGKSLEKIFTSLKVFLRTNAEDITNIAEQTCKILSSTPFVGLTFAFIRPIVKAINNDSAVDKGIVSTIQRFENIMSRVLDPENIDQGSKEVSSFLNEMMKHYVEIGKLKQRNKEGKLMNFWGAKGDLGKLESLNKTIDDYLRIGTFANTMAIKADTKKILNIVEENNQPLELEKESIDAYFAMQYPSKSLDNIDGRPWFHSELEKVKRFIEKDGKNEFVDLENEGFKCFLSDGDTQRLRNKMESIRLLVWCSMGYNEAANSQAELFPTMFKDVKTGPEIVVVVMRFGAEYVASQLIEAGVPKVFWIQKDPYEDKELTTLFRETLLPICKELVLVRDLKDFHNEHSRKDKMGPLGSHDPISKRSPKKSKGIKVELGQTNNCATSSWFRSRKAKNLKTLKMDACDFEKMGELEERILDNLNDDESHVFFITPDEFNCGNEILIRAYERSRALLLSVCNKIAAKKRFAFGDMRHFGSEKNLQDFMNHENQSEDNEMYNKMLIWIDIESKISESQTMKDFGDMVQEGNRTIIVLISNDYSQAEFCGNAENKTPNLKENQWITKVDRESYSNFSINSNSLTVEIPVSNLRGIICIKEVSASIELKKLGCALKKFLLSCNVGLKRTMGIDVEIFSFDSKSIMIRVSVMDIKFLATLRDKILLEGKEVKLKLAEDQGSKESKADMKRIQFDASSVATMYEELMVQFDVLTDHQKEALNKCANEKSVQIEGPAGTGKTFIALHSILEFFHKTTSVKDSKNVLFICCNESLAFFFANWLHNRWANQKENTDTVLQHFFFLSLAKGGGEPIIRSFEIKGCELDDKEVPVNFLFGKIVIDEAHSVFLKEKMEIVTSDILKKHDGCEVMFLSDVSQAVDSNVKYPGNPKLVNLSEVCRSSKRIVSGAFPFQLGTSEVKEVMSCIHDSDGPPLKPFLFSCDDSMKEFAMYEHKIKNAIGTLMEAFPNLNLHDRLAIVVPDDKFCEKLCDQLLSNEENRGHFEVCGQKLEIKRALEASKTLKFYKRKKTKKNWIVVDTIDHFEGLERLIVFGVGLDEDLNKQDVEASLVRSRIYRTITRAHMVFYLINKRVPGGWFEFLDDLKYNTDRKFDYNKEILEYDSTAAHHTVEAAAHLVEESNYDHESIQNTRKNQIEHNSAAADNVIKESAMHLADESNNDNALVGLSDSDRKEFMKGKEVSSSKEKAREKVFQGTWQINDEKRAEESIEKRFNPYKVTNIKTEILDGSYVYDEHEETAEEEVVQGPWQINDEKGAEERIKNRFNPDDVTNIKTEIPDGTYVYDEHEDLKSLGISVSYLANQLLQEVVEAGLKKSSTIHDLENLADLDHDGFIRRKGANVTCPIDDKKGDITDTLQIYCKDNGKDPDNVFVYICCFCINQHRVVDIKRRGEVIPSQIFFSVFEARINKIGHILAIMAPWQEPIYLTRIWCLYEMFSAMTHNCKIEIAMPPAETERFIEGLRSEDGNYQIDALFSTIAKMDVARALATVVSDLTEILKIIDEGVGYANFNMAVSVLIRKWAVGVVVTAVKEGRQDREDESSKKRHGALLNKVAHLLLGIGGNQDRAMSIGRDALVLNEELYGRQSTHTAQSLLLVGRGLSVTNKYNEALKILGEALEIFELIFGRVNKNVAEVLFEIGAVLNSKGENDKALKVSRESLSIQEQLFGRETKETTQTRSSIATMLAEKDEDNEALKLNELNIKIQRKYLGQEHPGTARTMNNIGILYAKKGEHCKALELYKNALQITEKVFGSDDPRTKDYRSNFDTAMREIENNQL